MAAKTLGVAVIGLGMGRACCKWVRESKNCKLTAVCDLNEERLAQVAKEFEVDGVKDYDALLARKDVDIAYIMTPSGLHAKQGIQAAQAGKHVVVAKPMDVTVQACDELIAACKKAGVLLAVDFNSRFSTEQQKIHFAVQEGLFGKLILGEGRLKWYRAPSYFEGARAWHGTWKMDGGGSLANQTIHQIDQILWHMGPVEQVVAAQTGIFAHENIETEDLGLALLRFRNGALGSIMGTTSYPKESPYAGIEIHGTEGGVLTTFDEPQWTFFDDARAAKLERCVPYKTSVENIAAVVNGETDKLVCDGAEGRRANALLTAIYTSAKEKRSVDLPAVK